MVFTFNFTCRYILYLQSFRVRQTLSLLHGWFSYKFLVLREVWSATFLLSDWWWILINNLLKSNNQQIIIPAPFFLHQTSSWWSNYYFLFDNFRTYKSQWNFTTDNLYPGKKKVRYWMFCAVNQPATTASHSGGWRETSQGVPRLLIQTNYF